MKSLPLPHWARERWFWFNPARQYKKATGLTGRQWRRKRKADNRQQCGYELDRRGRIVGRVRP